MKFDKTFIFGCLCLFFGLYLQNAVCYTKKNTLIMEVEL